MFIFIFEYWTLNLGEYWTLSLGNALSVTMLNVTNTNLTKIIFVLSQQYLLLNHKTNACIIDKILLFSIPSIKLISHQLDFHLKLNILLVSLASTRGYELNAGWVGTPEIVGSTPCKQTSVVLLPVFWFWDCWQSGGISIRCVWLCSVNDICLVFGNKGSMTMTCMSDDVQLRVSIHNNPGTLNDLCSILHCSCTMADTSTEAVVM